VLWLNKKKVKNDRTGLLLSKSSSGGNRKMLRGAAMNGERCSSASHSRTVYIRFERIKEIKEGRGGPAAAAAHSSSSFLQFVRKEEPKGRRASCCDVPRCRTRLYIYISKYSIDPVYIEAILPLACSPSVSTM
jgi:hypothetical protein